MGRSWLVGTPRRRGVPTFPKPRGLRAGNEGGVPIEVPIIAPEFGKFDQFAVAVGEAHVDRSRQRLPRCVRHAARGRSAAVTENRATAHPVSFFGYGGLTKVKIDGWRNGFQWNGSYEVLV